MNIDAAAIQVDLIVSLTVDATVLLRERKLPLRLSPDSVTELLRPSGEVPVLFVLPYLEIGDPVYFHEHEPGKNRLEPVVEMLKSSAVVELAMSTGGTVT
jgi:hypothetical protein